MTVSGFLMALWIGLLIGWSIGMMLQETGVTPVLIPRIFGFGTEAILLLGVISVSLCRIYR